MSRFLQIRDQYTELFGRRFLNSQLSFYICIFQLIICVWALAQHVYSFVVFDTILFCDFSDNSTLPAVFTGVDAIIFDVGLFHNLWGISGCVAQHLDGGYGRFAWCVTHTTALLINMPISFMNRPKPFYMWPLLIQQSAYGIGLLILSLAALPRILPTFMGKLDNAPISAIITYFFGTSVNFFLLVVYWHFYWHVETEFDSARKVPTSRVQKTHGRQGTGGRNTTISSEPPPLKLLRPTSTIQTAAHVPTANGTSLSTSLQPNGLARTCSIPVPTNGHLPNGRAAAVANALKLSPSRLPNSSGSITLLQTNGQVLRRTSAADSPTSSQITSSSGCSSSTPRRRLPLLNPPPYAPAQLSSRPVGVPASQLSTMSLPLSQRLPDNRATTGLGFIPVSRLCHENSRRPSSARNKPMEWPTTHESARPVVFTHSPPAPHLRTMRRYQSAGNWQQRTYGSPLLHDDRRLPDLAESDLLTPSPITPVVSRNVGPFSYCNEFVPGPAPSGYSPVVSRLRLEQSEMRSMGDGRHHSLSGV